MVTVMEVAEFLSSHGPTSLTDSVAQCYPAPVLEAGVQGVSFVNGFGSKAVKVAKSSKAGVLVIDERLGYEPSCVVCRVPNPRLTFARLLSLFPSPNPRVTVGDDCLLARGVVLGASGFGYVRDEKGRPVRFPHIGGVTIGKRVEIGANSCVDRGALADTVIGDDTKLDNLVHVAHNVHIGKDCLIAAGATVCGSAFIGDRVWIGPGAVISDYVQIGDDAEVSIGSVVVKDVPAKAHVTGYFAIEHAKYLRGAR